MKLLLQIMQLLFFLLSLFFSSHPISYHKTSSIQKPILVYIFPFPLGGHIKLQNICKGKNQTEKSTETI